MKTIVEKRIRAELEAISITKEFYEWGVVAIKSVSTALEESKALSLLKKRRTELQVRLSGLIKMRADGELDKEQFELFKTDLSTELAQIGEELQVNTNLDRHIDIEALEYFDFAYYCISEYKKNDPATNTQLLSRLGSNLTLKDKKLVITTEKVLKRIKECEVSYYLKKASFEPKKTIKKQRVVSNFYPAFAVLRSKLKAIRTCLKDKVLRRVEENLKNGRPPFDCDEHKPLLWPQ